MVYGETGVVHEVEHGPAEVLRNDHHLWQVVLIVLVDADVERLVLGAHGVIGEPYIFVDDAIDIGGYELVLLAARYEEDALNDIDGPLAVFDNLGHVVAQVGDDIVDVLAVVLGQPVLVVVDDVRQVAQEFVGHLTEVDDEVERILYLVGDTGTKHSQGGELLLLLQLLF